MQMIGIKFLEIIIGNMKDKIVENVLNKYISRSNVGITKYGTTLDQNNTDNYLIHLQQECMDASLYIEKILSIGKHIQELIKENPNDTELGTKIRQIYGQ
jgi:hypothetical protein